MLLQIQILAYLSSGIYLMKKISLFLFFIINTTSLQAQLSSIRGTVTDSVTNVHMMAVTVSVKGTSFAEFTDSAGNYMISNIPSGTYVVDFSFIGYRTVEFTGIKLSTTDGPSLFHLDVKLMPTTLTIGEGITVYGDKPLVDVDDAGSGSHLKKETIEALPNR